MLMVVMMARESLYLHKYEDHKQDQLLVSGKTSDYHRCQDGSPLLSTGSLAVIQYDHQSYQALTKDTSTHKSAQIRTKIQMILSV